MQTSAIAPAPAPAPAKRTRGRPALDMAVQLEEHLLTVALKEFLAKGYGGASMSQIVRAAGVSKTTLYSRFNSKEALFRAIMHRQVDRLAAATSFATASGSVGLIEGLKAYANRTLEISLEGDLLAVNRLINSEAIRFPELGLAAAERSAMGILQVTSFIDQCAKSTGQQIADARLSAEAFILMLRGWYVNVLLAHLQVTPEERRQWVEQIVPAFVKGCCLTQQAPAP